MTTDTNEPEEWQWIRHWLKKQTQADDSALTVESSLHSLGLTSATLIEMAKEFEQRFGKAVVLAELFACSTIGDVCQLVTGASSSQSAAVAAAGDSSVGDQIAISGIGLRLPSGVRNMGELWQLLDSMTSLIGATPNDEGRFAGKDVPDHSAYFDEQELQLSDDEAARLGGAGAVSKLAMAEQLVLATVVEALTDAELLSTKPGRAPKLLAEAGTVGLIYSQPLPWQKVAASQVVSTVEYTLGMTGTCYALDTACSSGAVAVHQAADMLRRGLCSTVVVAGLNLLLHCAGDAHDDDRRHHHPLVRPAGQRLAARRGVRSAGAATHCRPSAPRPPVRQRHCHWTALWRQGVSSQAINGAVAAALASCNTIDPVNDICLAELSGTASPIADGLELTAVQKVLGSKPPGSLTIATGKPTFGHTGPVAPLLQMCKAIAQLNTGVAPANPGTQSLSAEFDWAGFPAAHFPLHGERRQLPDSPLRAAIVLSLANACTILVVDQDEQEQDE